MKIFKSLREHVAITLCVSLLVLVFGVAGFIFAYLERPLIPLTGSPITYYFPPGSHTQKLANDLAQRQLIQFPRLFVWWIRIAHKSGAVRAGEYRFNPGITLPELIDTVVNGKVVQYPFTLVEGWTFAQVNTKLYQTQELNHLLITKNNLSMLPPFHIGRFTPEGWLFPDTYYFIKGETDIDLLQRAHLRMQQKLQTAWQKRAADLPYRSPYEALIVASLIERETAIAAERPLIAEVVLQRLQLKMPLQIDAAVIYGLGDHYHGKLTKNDLLTNTPYNTYLHLGLPPTPIAAPGLASVEAALHPSHTGFIYYVAKGDGTHYFSYTLAEHEQAVLRYQKHKQKVNHSD